MDVETYKNHFCPISTTMKRGDNMKIVRKYRCELKSVIKKSKLEKIEGRNQ